MGNYLPPKMLYNDYADARLGASLIGHGGTADPDYPFANVLNRDRHTVGKIISPPSTCDVDIAIDNNREIYGVGFGNLYSVSGTSLPNVGVEIWAAENAAFTQNPQLVATITQGPFLGPSSFTAPRTHGVIFTSAFSSRYWRFRFKGWVSFFAGRLMLFGAAYDMPAAGTGPRKGSGFAIVSPRNRGRRLGGGPVIEDIGAQTQRFTLRFRGTDESIRNQVEALAAQRRPWLHTDQDGSWFHVEMTETGDEQKFDQVGVGYPNVWETTVETEHIAP